MNKEQAMSKRSQYLATQEASPHKHRLVENYRSYFERIWRHQSVALFISGKEKPNTCSRIVEELEAYGAKLVAVIVASQEDVMFVEPDRIFRLVQQNSVEEASPMEWPQAAELENWLSGFDPEKKLVFLAGVTFGYPTIAERRVYGWRRKSWANYEDKTEIDACFSRWAVPSPRFSVINASLHSALSAYNSVRSELGVIIALDSSMGHRGDAKGLAWATSESEVLRIVKNFRGSAKRLRIAEFIEGVPCSILGLCLPRGVGIFDPIEVLTVTAMGSRDLVFCGTSTFIRLPRAVVKEMRSTAYRVGAGLKSEVGYLGLFSVDGIWSNEGFFATEVNPRHASGLGIINALPEFPIYLLNRAVQEEEEFLELVDIQEFEYQIRDIIKCAPSYSVYGKSVLENFRKEVLRLDLASSMSCSGASVDMAKLQNLAEFARLGPLAALAATAAYGRPYAAMGTLRSSEEREA